MLKFRGKRIYLACWRTDTRKSIDGLSALVSHGFKLDPFGESIFVFCNRDRDRIKILEWDGNGFWAGVDIKIMYLQRTRNHVYCPRGFGEDVILMPQSENQPSDRIYIDELSHLVEEFREKISAGMKNPDQFLTMTEIERLWGELRGNTSIIYSDMLQEILSSVDESDLIRQKKTNTGAKG